MRLLKAQTGEQLFKAVQIKVFYPGNKKSALQVHRAPHGNGLTSDGIDQILASTAEKIEKVWPGQEYSMVALGPAAFNFVWRKTTPVVEASA
jgi:acetylornithine deacetylase/succinyl-diaminopimelate desuccinylase-like protein